MNKLYYTVEVEHEEDYLTGNKEVSVYDIKNNKPILIVILDLELTDNSKDRIIDELQSIGYNVDIEFELELL